MTNYPFATLTFLNIDNIHVVRDALAELRATLVRQERDMLQQSLLQSPPLLRVRLSRIAEWNSTK
jgi:hypothetical protein